MTLKGLRQIGVSKLRSNCHEVNRFWSDPLIHISVTTTDWMCFFIVWKKIADKWYRNYWSSCTNDKINWNCFVTRFSQKKLFFIFQTMTEFCNLITWVTHEWQFYGKTWTICFFFFDAESRKMRKTQKKNFFPQQDARNIRLRATLNLRIIFFCICCVPPSSVLPIISLDPGMFLLVVWPICGFILGYTFQVNSKTTSKIKSRKRKSH